MLFINKIIKSHLEFWSFLLQTSWMNRNHNLEIHRINKMQIKKSKIIKKIIKSKPWCIKLPLFNGNNPAPIFAKLLHPLYVLYLLWLSEMSLFKIYLPIKKMSIIKSLWFLLKWMILAYIINYKALYSTSDAIDGFCMIGLTELTQNLLEPKMEHIIK